MKHLFAMIAAVCLLQCSVLAQLTTVADGGNKKAMVGERIGLTDVTIHYDRPAVKGREGKIWGGLVPFGLTDLGFGTSKAAPWRAGANENTTIEFSTDVMIEGKPLTAGKYGVFIEVGKEESILIFSKNSTSWGSFFYDPKEDALRVNIKQLQLDKPVERLLYQFVNQTANSAAIALQWEKWQFAFKVEVDVEKTQLQSFRNELRSEKGFDWKAFVQAVDWCADHKTNLEEALQWADYSINAVYVGEKNFRTLSAKARILSLLNKETEAAGIMKEALPLGSVTDVHNYARQLLAAKKTTAAAEVFRANYKKFPNTFTTNMGMARALSSEGNFKEALKYVNTALTFSSDPDSKSIATAAVEKLKAGKDINQ